MLDVFTTVLAATIVTLAAANSEGKAMSATLKSQQPVGRVEKALAEFASTPSASALKTSLSLTQAAVNEVVIDDKTIRRELIAAQQSLVQWKQAEVDAKQRLSFAKEQEGTAKIEAAAARKKRDISNSHLGEARSKLSKTERDLAHNSGTANTLSSNHWWWLHAIPVVGSIAHAGIAIGAAVNSDIAEGQRKDIARIEKEKEAAETDLINAQHTLVRLDVQIKQLSNTISDATQKRAVAMVKSGEYAKLQVSITECKDALSLLAGNLREAVDDAEIMQIGSTDAMDLVQVRSVQQKIATSARQMSTLCGGLLGRVHKEEL